MSWERIHFSSSENRIFSFFVVFGAFEEDISISASKYNFSEIPDNTDIQKYHDGAAPEYRDSFRSGYLWEEICDKNPKLAEEIRNAPSCMVISTDTGDQDTLDYLRNLVGLTTYFLDNGGVCVYEPQRFKWWTPAEWTENIFIHKKPKIFEHTTILVSEQENGNHWYHTRGLRLFARPEISVHDVTDELAGNVHEMINRFIEFQALGGIIENGQSIKMKGLPISMWCEHKGDEDDPDFNNKHVEIHWQ